MAKAIKATRKESLENGQIKENNQTNSEEKKMSKAILVTDKINQTKREEKKMAKLNKKLKAARIEESKLENLRESQIHDLHKTHQAHRNVEDKVLNLEDDLNKPIATPTNELEMELLEKKRQKHSVDLEIDALILKLYKAQQKSTGLAYDISGIEDSIEIKEICDEIEMAQVSREMFDKIFDESHDDEVIEWARKGYDNHTRRFVENKTKLMNVMAERC